MTKGSSRGKPKRTENKQNRAENRRQKKNRKDQDDDDDDVSALTAQLLALGLTLREVPGDGNCMFRALSDQLHGGSDRHLEFRAGVVEFMKSNREDFEPFLVDETSFERHLRELATSGTYGANDSLVAFSRLSSVAIVIHQLNEPMWRVDSGGGGGLTKELHISYHNGNHYNSVRRIGEVKSARVPANITINLSDSSKSDPPIAAAAMQGQPFVDPAWRDNDKAILSDGNEDLTELERDIRQVMRSSGTEDELMAQRALVDNAYCIEAAVDFLLQWTNLADDPPPASLWEPEGTACRIFGDSAASDVKAADGAAAAAASKSKSCSTSAATRKAKLQQQPQHGNQAKLSNKKRKQLKKFEGKMANDERKRDERRQEDNGDVETTISAPPDIQALSI